MTEEESNLPPLPKGWTWTRIGDISEKIHYGYTAKSSNESIGPKMLRITDIQNRAVKWETVPFCQIDEEKKTNYLLRDGDLVFARTGATVGKSFLIKGKIPEAVFASYLIRVILSSQIRREYVYYFFQSPKYWLQIYEGQIGIGQPNVNSRKLSKLSIPLPPFPEQSRIVGKVEELFSRLDAGVDSLRSIKVQLRRYRQTVLKNAFGGKLTEEWRKTHKDEIQPASMLLKHIKENREKTTRGKYKELPSIDTSDLPELPESWVWTRLSNISSKVTDGTHFTPTYVDQGVPFISVKNIFGRKIFFDNCKYISEEEHTRLSRRCDPEYLDILITKSGTIGRTCVVETTNPFSLFVSVALIKPFKKYLNSNYISYSLENYINNLDIQQSIKGGVIKNLHIEDLRKIILPLAPFVEQNRIVEEINSYFSIADKVEKAVESILFKSAQLRQGILKKAFEGRLVPQDPTDEPAEKLLERIREWREKRNVEKKKIKPGRRSKQEQLGLSHYVK